LLEEFFTLLLIEGGATSHNLVTRELVFSLGFSGKCLIVNGLRSPIPRISNLNALPKPYTNAFE